LEDCEEEQSFWKLYIQMVFGTDFMLIKESFTVALHRA